MKTRIRRKEPLPRGLRLAAGSLLALTLTLAAGGLASAQSITFTASQASSNLAASVTFTALAGNELEVSLTNSYTGDTLDQAHILTGVFFSGATGLTPVSATAGSGSVEWRGTSHSAPDSSSILGTEWAYASAAGAPGGAASGIVGAGYWTGVGSGNFATPGDSLDGTSYGIISAGYAGSDGDGLHANPYIQGSMVFVLSGFTGSLSGISDISFQYGSTLAEPDLTGIQITPVPEPSILADAAVVAVMILAWAGWRGARLRSKTGGSNRRF